MNTDDLREQFFKEHPNSKMDKCIMPEDVGYDYFTDDYVLWLEEKLILSGVMHWVAVDDELPPILETIWLSNGKGWTDLGCRVETNDGWHWAGQNGIIYQEKDQIVAECNSDDLDVVYWCKLPKPPCV
jgi:hypothetical protein